MTRARCKPVPPKRASKLEERFEAEILLPELEAGRIVRYEYEGLSLLVGAACGTGLQKKKARYTPDFYVLQPGGSICLYETKGHMREAARVRIAAAAKLYPEFSFVLVTHKKATGWKFETIAP